ncbi:MAG TPA: hypothetical protein VN426_05650 [Syntrophomonadaceae bacterium]|nr:hypothetical protein [Syntrophomonadaceae bacterium]
MRKYVVMLLIAAILQIAIYFYLDRVVLVPAANFSQRIITDEAKSAVNPQNISKDQKYYAELEPTCVKFFTADNVLVKEVPLQVEDSVSCFSWVPDTHLTLIGISSSTSQGTSVTLKSVDLDSDISRPELMISGLSSGSTIVAAAFSPQGNASYIQVKDSMESSVYRSDANNHLIKVFTGSSVLRIAVMQSEETLLYDSNQEGAVYALSKDGKPVMVSPQEGQYALIGTDQDDNIYIGRLSSPGVISDVLKGAKNGNFTEFQTLAYPYPVASVTINYDGKLVLA